MKGVTEGNSLQVLKHNKPTHLERTYRATSAFSSCFDIFYVYLETKHIHKSISIKGAVA